MSDLSNFQLILTGALVFIGGLILLILESLPGAIRDRQLGRDAWRRLTVREAELAQRWLAYEKDPRQAMARPDLRDPNNPHVQRVVEAMLAARVLRAPRPSRRARSYWAVQDSEYRRAVLAFESALDAAESAPAESPEVAVTA